MESPLSNCKVCQARQGFIEIGNTPTIFSTEFWYLVHAYPVAIEGWLVLVLKRHCRSLHELTAAEFAELGALLPLIIRSFHEILHTEKEYLMQFAEGKGFEHIHFHFVPRSADWPEELKGWRVFKAIGENVPHPLSGTELAPLVEKFMDFFRREWRWSQD